jgi:hypothetical protein
MFLFWGIYTTILCYFYKKVKDNYLKILTLHKTEIIESNLRN